MLDPPYYSCFVPQRVTARVTLSRSLGVSSQTVMCRFSHLISLGIQVARRACLISDVELEVQRIVVSEALLNSTSVNRNSVGSLRGCEKAENHLRRKGSRNV